MLLRSLPLLTGLLPVLAVHASYALAIAADSVPACLPYIDGCTSISATGRYPPASYLFRALMLPEAVLLALFWLYAVAWLRVLDEASGNRGRPAAHVAVLGLAGAAALVVYVTFLGTQEAFYEFMRRFGIYLFFLFTVLAQIALSLRSRDYAQAVADPVFSRIVNAQLAFTAVPFAMGLLNLLLKAVLEDADRQENVIEWIVVLFMQAWFLLAWLAWRRTGFSASFALKPVP